jgi:hypothetical protein
MSGTSIGRWWVLALFAVISMGLGCDTSGSASDEETAAAEESPESIAKENNESAEEELALSDKGKDDEGEKVWKQEARDFFDYQKNPRNGTFELSSGFARQFTNDVYAAGAEKVWVTGISEIELGQNKLNISDNLVVVLPADATKRKAVFDVYNRELAKADEPPLKDIGQKYIFLTGD